MISQIRPAMVLFLVLTVITGVAYPLAVTGVARLMFPWQAQGSPIVRGGRTVGSVLIAQPFTDARYFWPRPSAASYNGAGGSGSNLGPSNPAQAEAVKARTDALRAADPANDLPVPPDLVTASGSGLDPHISVEGARYQLPRIARVRNVPAAGIDALVARHTSPRTLGVLGEPTVNVLQLNLALDELRPPPAATTRSAS